MSLVLPILDIFFLIIKSFYRAIYFAYTSATDSNLLKRMNREDYAIQHWQILVILVLAFVR